MTEPALDLRQAKRLMDALYERDDHLYVFAFHDKNCAIYSCQSRFRYGNGRSVLTFIEVAESLGMAVATSVGVFDPETPGIEARRSTSLPT